MVKIGQVGLRRGLEVHFAGCCKMCCFLRGKKVVWWNAETRRERARAARSGQERQGAVRSGNRI